jgi:hypothetical protein
VLNPLADQPTLGSCWLVQNRFTVAWDWNPQPAHERHPVVCMQGGSSTKLRRMRTLRSVPRTTLEPRNASDDPTIVETAPGVTPYLDKRGWFLARFVKPVQIDGFEGFAEQLYRGNLPDAVVSTIENALKLPRLP